MLGKKAVDAVGGYLLGAGREFFLSLSLFV